ncbi:MAG: extracellular solute-binding protein [Lachnospiraceae bacterium]|nr:extracellular solute-binding protein [Lachnospiraceae bacterium]
MNRKKIAWLLVVVMLCSALCGCGENQKRDDKESAQPVNYDNLMEQWSQQVDVESDVLTCWYTDEADKAWLESSAKKFEKEYAAKVNLVYYDGISLFEDMNQANQKEEGPDLYLLGNDQLQIATQSGLAEELSWLQEEYFLETYSEVARKATNYQGKQYGYPLYFDTYCLVYDANLLETAPASIEDIITFLDAYEDTGSTKAVFRWDVADPYINSMFLGSYANLFGENGDEPESFTINNEQCIATMEYFQSLSAYLWMDKDNISHDTVMNRIKDGTLVLGLCKSDMLPDLYTMQEESVSTTEQDVAGEASGEATEAEMDNVQTTNYQISYVPSLTAELSSTSFSTTYSAFVNPYGKNNVLANMFGLYLSISCGENQFETSGKLPVVEPKDGLDDVKKVVYAQYRNSKPVPKVVVLGDYLTESAIAFDAIWEGNDVTEQLNQLQQTMEEKIQ